MRICSGGDLHSLDSILYSRDAGTVALCRSPRGFIIAHRKGTTNGKSQDAQVQKTSVRNSDCHDGSRTHESHFNCTESSGAHTAPFGMQSKR
jgi:hypothetical protein